MPLYEDGSPLNNSAVGVAAAAVAVALTPTPTGLAYITGFAVTCTAPAAVQAGVVTVTGVNTLNNVPLSYQFVESVTFGGELIVLLPGDGLPAYARGQAITVTLPAIASGGAGAVAVYGYQL